MKRAIILIIATTTVNMLFAQSLQITSNQKIEYTTSERGDRIPDFSYCGYMASEQEIPFVPAKVYVACDEDDATERIQQAIDYVSSLPVDKNGFRGAVELEKGHYRMDGSLSITASGVVLRGKGYQEDGTVLFATGTHRETLIRIYGKPYYSTESVQIAGDYVPVNAVTIPLPDSHTFKAGDKVVITRPSTAEWLSFIGADKIGIYVDYQLWHWTQRDFDLKWKRTVVAADKFSITLDAPVTCAMEKPFGMGYVSYCNDAGIINRVGIENLRCVSEFNAESEKDENHRWMAITVENAEDGWVRRVAGEHFVSSTVALWESVRRFTVEDCKSLAPVGEIGGYRRYAFQTSGQQTLISRCYSEYGYHDFSVGYTAAGPNAFVQCYAYRPYEFSGTLGGWACGTLFDRQTVDGGALKIKFRDVDGQGAGWSGVNSVCWEARTPQLHLDMPPGAYNWAFGTWGQGYGNGLHLMPRTFLKPPSLFYAQLEERTGKKSPDADKIITVQAMVMEQTNPAFTALMNERSVYPELIVDKWIDTLAVRFPLVSSAQVPEIGEITFAPKVTLQKENIQPIIVENGVISLSGEPLTGRTQRTALWRGNLRPSIVDSAGIHLTRFVPGREGTGYTDNLDTLTNWMKRNGTVSLQHFPALWYERRRDDHGRSLRVDADVWAPFYEQPFSRTGIGEAFDRLSKYDLNAPNPWYWNRLKAFANLADREGLLFIEEHYLQHNIIEEGAHWADYPWRSANNINEPGFPENVYYSGDKRVFMANHFYDLNNKNLVELHKKNIRYYLDNLGDNQNVVHHLGVEYTGPVKFVKFWLDVISEWEKEKGKKVLTMLSATKDVTDSILAEKHYAGLLDIIDIRQWHHRNDGTLYAPQGGVSLTQRQYARIMDVGTVDNDGVYEGITEYKNTFPDKAVVYNVRAATPLKEWIAFVAGASLCNLPEIRDTTFFNDVSLLKPMEKLTQKSKQWGMGKTGMGYIICVHSDTVTLDLSDDKNAYSARWLDTQGRLLGMAQVIGGKLIQLEKPFDQDAILRLGNAQPVIAAEKVLDAMKHATRFMVEKVGNRGAYVWQYLPDMSRRWGELEALSTMGWVQNPGTVAMGNLFLDAYHATGDEYYYNIACEVANILIENQLECGGWNYLFDLAGEESTKRWYDTYGRQAWRMEEFQHYYGNATFDDGSTISAAEFLIRIYVEKHEETFKPALDKAIHFVLESQYPSGGWPQRYPTEMNYDILGEKNYASFITFNDDVCFDNVEFLIQCYQFLGMEHLKPAIYRAMDLVKNLQTPPPYSGWADQYTLDFKPAGARTYEPKGLSASTTMKTIQMLQGYYKLTADPKYLEGIPDAIEFLKLIKLSESQVQQSGRNRPANSEAFMTGRFINDETGLPQFVHREGSNIANGRYFADQNPANTIGHMSSFSSANINALLRNLEEVKKIPVDYLKETSPLLTKQSATLPVYYNRNASSRRYTNVEQVIGGLTEDGAWLTPMRTTSNLFKQVTEQEPSKETRYASTDVGDEYDTSPYPLMGQNAGFCITTSEYINNMMMLIRYLDNLKD